MRAVLALTLCLAALYGLIVFGAWWATRHNQPTLTENGRPCHVVAHDTWTCP